jgi:hypothetical protein
MRIDGDGRHSSPCTWHAVAEEEGGDSHQGSHLLRWGGGRPRREQPQRGVGAPPATHLLQVESPCEGPLQPTGARALAAGLWRGGVGVVCVCVCE